MILYFKSFGTGVKLIYLRRTRDNFCPFLRRLISLVVSLICNNLLVNKNSVGKYIYGISSSKVENASALFSYANEYHCCCHSLRASSLVRCGWVERGREKVCGFFCLIFFLSLILPLLSFFFAEYRTYLKLSLLSIAGVPGEKP